MRKFVPLLLVAFLAVPAWAGELAGVSLPDRAVVAGRPLVLSGMALRRVVFFKVYVAGMYLPMAPESAEKVLAEDGPRRVVMHFLRGLKAGDLSGAWMEGLEANTPQAGPEVRAAFDTLCSWMADVEEGQEMVVTYVPGTGTSVSLAGTLKGTLPGKPFADALFACWIGPEPGPGKDFKRDLLGG